MTMTTSIPTPQEMAVMEALSSDNPTQRAIAMSSGFSLGMTNLLLKRLASKGYVKVVSLNGRTLRYILTPRGFKEKLARSYSFLQNSIRNLKEIKSKIQDIVQQELLELKEGELNADLATIAILGAGELGELAAEALLEVGLEPEGYRDVDSLLGAVTLRPALVLQCDPDMPFHEAEVATQVRVIEFDRLLGGG